MEDGPFSSIQKRTPTIQESGVLNTISIGWAAHAPRSNSNFSVNKGQNTIRGDEGPIRNKVREPDRNNAERDRC